VNPDSFIDCGSPEIEDVADNNLNNHDEFTNSEQNGNGRDNIESELQRQRDIENDCEKNQSVDT